MRRAISLAAIVAAAAYVITYGLVEGTRDSAAFDVYGYFYPNILHALRSVANGGRGLLWNPFQNCGQPFFAISETGLLYPLNLFFLALEPERALRAVLFTNLAIGGLATWGLGRELGVSRVGALGMALAFTLGNSAYYLTTWMPTVQAPFIWMPAAMWCCERLVKRPDLRHAVLLGVVLALSLLPGHPQFVLFTCELVALRLAWGVFDTSERRCLPRAIAGVALAALVMLLLTAVQLLPSLEVARESVRHAPLRPDEIEAGVTDTWARIAEMVHVHNSLAPFTIVPAFLAAVSIVSPARRRVALFYFLAGALFLTLSLGNETGIGRLYSALPGVGMFRGPMRFRFVTGFCTSVLAGLAIDALAAGSWSALAVAGAALAALYAWLGRFWPIDWALAGTVLGGGMLAAAAPVARPLATPLIAATIALAPIVAPAWSVQLFLADDTPLRVHARLLERLRARLTPQDRVAFALPSQHDAGLEEKTATLFGIPSITDYEMQMAQRYAEYVTTLRTADPFESVNQVYFPGGWDGDGVAWPLVHLAAARYILVDRSLENDLDPDGHARLTPVDGDDGVRVYENPDALPRAYYVPQIVAQPDGEAGLKRLAWPRGDWRRLALVDSAPRSGFLGVPGNQATGEARFVVDDPERVVLEVVAPEHGFLFLADQYFPGWTATVNGEPSPILVADHAFRLVEVPAGPVTVEFRYRSTWLRFGALVSGVTLLVVVGVLISTSRGASPPAGPP